MSDFLRSAFEYISGLNNKGDEIVGQNLEIGCKKVKIKKLIAEGGFAYVFLAEDLSSGKEYALKRIIAVDKEASASITQEIEILKLLSGSKYIIEFVSAVKLTGIQNQDEYWLMTELCVGGLSEMLKDINLLPGDVFKIFFQICQAVLHMHNQTPPIIHRDLKIENLLLGYDGKIKLCDFGSATTEVFKPDYSWSSNQRGMLEDELTRYTTPMYRAPEIVDTWCNYPITSKCDIWALGCILYLLCYKQHPFEDASKLSILNANYKLPPESDQYFPFQELICEVKIEIHNLKYFAARLLCISPIERPTIIQVIDMLNEINEVWNFNKIGDLDFLKKGKVKKFSHDDLKLVDSHINSEATQQGKFFNSIKGGASNLLKNIWDTSNRVVQSVQQSISRVDLDVTYITSKILVLSYPADALEVYYRNYIDDVRIFLDSHHFGHYIIFNISGRSYPSSKFNAKIIDCGWTKQQVPILSNLFCLCQNMYDYLSQCKKNVCVIHCMDDKANSALLVCSFFLYLKLFNELDTTLNMFAQRCKHLKLSPSQYRYLNYMHKLTKQIPVFPLSKKIIITSLSLCPVPLFSKMRDGCRPFLELYCGVKKILSTIQEYSLLRPYIAADKKIIIPVNANVQGDLNIIVYHGRRELGKFQAIKMFQLQLYSGFEIETIETNQLLLYISDLDGIREPDRFPPGFQVSLGIMEFSEEMYNKDICPWLEDNRDVIADVAFDSQWEMKQIIQQFDESKIDLKLSNGVKMNDILAGETIESLDINVNNSVDQNENDLASPIIGDLLNLNGELCYSSNLIENDFPLKKSLSNVDLLESLQTSVNAPSSSSNLFPSMPSITHSISASNFSMFDQQKLFSGGSLLLGMSNHSEVLTKPLVRNSSTPNLDATKNSHDLFADLVFPVESKGLQSKNSSVSFSKPAIHSQAGLAANTGFVRPRLDSDAFGDLLGTDFVTSRKDVQPRNINEMRKEILSQEMNPDELKVAEWTEGKQKNIRALLCSLHMVLWESCDKWSCTGMHQLLTESDVKRFYRKACLIVHPDKHQDGPYATIAKLIFMELSNAWSEFENDTSQHSINNLC